MEAARQESLLLPEENSHGPIAGWATGLRQRRRARGARSGAGAEPRGGDGGGVRFP